MKHLDDGILQAWLDGPRSGLGPLERDGIELHLSECERCAQRVRDLEGETVLVDALLSGSGPEDEAIPPFDEVLARAHKNATARRRRTGWTRAGWAATVAAAGVVGWMANGVYTSEVLNRDADRDADEAFQPATEASRARADVTPTAGLEAGAGEADVTLAEAERELGPESNLPLAPEGQSAIARRARDLSAPEEAEALAKMADDTVAADVRLGESAVALEQLAVTAVPAESRAREAEEASAGTAQPAADPGAPAEAAAVAAPGPWRIVSWVQAEAEAGFSILTVPDLPVVRIEVGSTDEGPLVRVLQEMGEGVLLEMVQGVGSEHAGRLIAPDEGSRATALRGDVLVVAVAPVSRDVLEGLLEGLR